MDKIELKVNGTNLIVEAECHEWLLEVLRDKLNLKSIKRGCDFGGCGACTVIIDGRALYSCMMPVIRVAGSKIMTVEGLARDGNLHPLQKAFVDQGAVQCGFCTPGMLLNAKALLDEISKPTEDDIRYGISGNLCRCTGYAKIVNAILSVAHH